jgi:DNA-binding CsgD family transcriptional regulator
MVAADEGSRATWVPAFAALLVELGMEEEARWELERVRLEGLDPLRSGLWLASLIFLSDACSGVGDRALAALLYPELAPLRGGNVVIGHGVACYGAADRFLGLLATALGEHARAIEHFERALAVNRRMGAVTWTAHTLYAYGRALRMRGGPGDGVQASELLSESAALASQIGMPALLDRARALGARPEGVRSPPAELSWREVEILRLVAGGLSNREIGEQLYISEHTVANHVRSILRKTGAGNRTEAAGYAHRNALLDPTESR